MSPHVARTAAATLEVSLGLPAVLLGAWAASVVAVPLGAETAEWLSIAGALLVGVSLFVVWVAARTRRRWLVVLGVATAVLAVLAVVVAARQVWSVREDPQLGSWGAVWLAVVDAGLWILVVVTTVVELRQPRPTGAARPWGWTQAVAVAVPLVLVVGASVVAGRTAASSMIRFNSAVTDHASAAPGRRSELSGGILWDYTFTAGAGAVVTRNGLAVPVPAGEDESAGVVLLDPATGATVWRYQLRGVDDPPELAATDDGRGLVVSFDDRDLAEDIPDRTFILDAGTGRIQAFWPDLDEGVTDPPVRFKHVPQGANSVIGLSVAGKELWTYRPESCADPRSVSSTPTVVIVYARQCGQGNGMEIIGLDTRTGERRWTQPAAKGESDPGTVVVGEGHRLELSGSELRDRLLDTGAVAWTTATATACSRPPLDSAAQTVFLGRCGDGSSQTATRLVAYAAATGDQLWERSQLQPFRSLLAVDDRRVLALSQGSTTCDVQLLEAARTTNLVRLPAHTDGDRRVSDVRCDSSRVLRAGDTTVLVLELWTPTSDSVRYRFVGLA